MAHSENAHECGKDRVRSSPIRTLLTPRFPAILQSIGICPHLGILVVVGRVDGGDEEEERFLTAQADTFAGANVKEKASARSVRNEGGCAPLRESGRWDFGRAKEVLSVQY